MTTMMTACRPLVANCARPPERAEISLCRYCGAECWRLATEPRVLPEGWRAACTACALRRGSQQKWMDYRLTVRVVSVREFVGGKDPEALARTIYVGRRSSMFHLPDHPLANPFKILPGATNEDRAAAVEKYRDWFSVHPKRAELLRELLGQVHATGFPLGCWCGRWPEHLELQCHAVVLASALNELDKVGPFMDDPPQEVKDHAIKTKP